MLGALRRDVASVLERDPAARSALEVVLTYPGLHAVWGHRVTARLWHGGHPLAAWLLAGLVRSLTNVDIHPAAVIGEGLFIDHAIGVVIGETVEIGRDVTIYQGVTLGGTSLEHGKRHPTLGDRVTVGAGAKVLGPITIGSGSRIGANAVVVRDVPPDSVVVGVPGQVIARSKPRTAAPMDVDDTMLPDLIGFTLGSLQRRIEDLERSVDGEAHTPALQQSASGVWAGEDFSI